MKEHILYSIKKHFITSPIFLIFFVTNTCNLRCGHCFYSEELDSKTPDLSLSEINTFSRQLGRLLEIDFAGGEPFLRKDLFEIYKIFIANNKASVISIPTNGTQTENIYSDVKQMLDHGGAQHLTIVLSIDGPAVVHDAIRGDSTYALVVNTYNALAELKKYYPQLQGYHIFLPVPIIFQNQGQKNLDYQQFQNISLLFSHQ
jgi:sulfatase maturation enzyme AslB (radical SAM superfamily)